MSVETAAPPKAKNESKPERRVLIRRVSWPSWLLRVFVESFFIMISILMALAVENWRENRQNRKLAHQALQIFEREIRQNFEVIEENVLYHAGLRSVVAEAMADPTQAPDMRSIMEGLRPVRLTNTAWQTTSASGGITHIDVETIWQLSLAYSFQERFRQQTLAAPPTFAMTAQSDPAEVERAVRATFNYLNELVTLEQDLRAAYRQALDIVRSNLPAPAAPAAADSSP